MNNPSALAALQTTLALAPESAHKGTIAACLSYRAFPLATDSISKQQWEEDESFFLAEALKGNGTWYGKLMADHTSKDWRDSIRATYGSEKSKTKVLVVASSRSGCFPAAGPMAVVDLVGQKAQGVVVEWGGHWCYWEDAEKFGQLCLSFLME
jgi:pimeloyl-ACP methyl ester carboxylesterase